MESSSLSPAQSQFYSSNITTRTNWQPWIICFTAALFYCYTYFLRVAPSNMMADLIHHFNIHAMQFGNLCAFYYYAYTPMQLPVGLIIDSFGARTVLAINCLIAALGLFIFTIADNYAFAATGRLLIGFGTAFAYISVLKLATIWLPPQRFAFVAGSTTALGMISATVSNFYLAKFVHQMGYQHALFSGIMVGVILAAILFLVIRNRPTNRFTPISNVSVSTAFAGLRAILKNRQMWYLGIMGALLYLPASMFLDVWGIPFLEGVYHTTPEQNASLVAMIFGGWIISAPLTGYISDRIHSRILPLAGGAILGALIIAVVIYEHQLSLGTLHGLLLLFGMCCGVHPLVFALGKEKNPPNMAGSALAVTNFLIMMGGVISQPLVGYLLDVHSHQLHLKGGNAVYSTEDFIYALSILPISLLLSLVFAWLIKDTKGKSARY